MNAKTGKILPLESLRGIAALSVVVYHDASASWLFGNTFFQHAYVMVDFFFVLSGYVIALNYFDRIDGPAALFRFQKKRFWRLYPLHLATLLAFLGIEIAKFAFERQTGTVANNPAFSVNDGWAFLANIFLAHSFTLPVPTFNIPSWSISAEFYTYLLFGLILISRRRAILVPGCAALAFVALGWATGGELSHGFLYSLPRCILSFLIGASAFLAMRRMPAVAQGGVPALTQPLALFLAALGVVLLAGTSAEIVLPLVFAFVVMAFSSGKTQPMARLLSARPLVYLGTISYSVYMTHSIVWWVTTQFARFGLGFETGVEPDGYVYVLAPAGFADLFTLTQIAVTIAVSHLTYRWIERPFRTGFRPAATIGAPEASGSA